MKHEWRKAERRFYLPKRKPETLTVPPLSFAVLAGKGNPNIPAFARYIEALYAVSYTVKMTAKRLDQPPEGYLDYTVYPLEGLWSLSSKGQAVYDGTLDKDELVFHLMIRQPTWVSAAWFNEMRSIALKKKGNELIEKVRLETIEDGRCVQMLHVGPYDDEPASFAQMEAFCHEQGLTRRSKNHREIYLSDVRKTAPEKLKTVLRFQVGEAQKSSM